ncbi:hypothetical protein GCM10010435_39830 [Winogradskya consettensis]|uniref:Uncharacterized protein n=1 Tax=Winogradskya consettensis TaxID=113560 RepID=A0A919VU40_9ACTN|nr:hypothetical protein [Actinoplanes consettensis]GIM69583.1 hypothetical protein Aco04nite_15960 [Actinoplanes consettensis]
MELYGSRADLLPGWMAKVVRAPEGSGRLLTWAGRPGIRLLDYAEHERCERDSLRRFPQDRDGCVDWAEVVDDLVAEGGEHLVQEFLGGGGEVMIMWGSLSVPSVALDGAGAASRVAEILDVDAVVWMVRSGLLLERNCFDDTVRVARVPVMVSE